jgi:hypothetical protein
LLGFGSLRRSSLSGWISSKFNRPINLLPSNFDSHEFFLVVSFGRCSLRLCSESVGLLLQSFIGGDADLFRVLPLSDRVFRFLLSCKSVGFAVYRLRSYFCSVFKAYLHLWNSGGPNWIIEWQCYSEEESKSWKLVSHRRSSPVSFADIVRKPALSGAHLVPLGRPVSPRRSSLRLKQWHSVFDRISFPLRPAIDQGYVVRPQFQKYSNYRIERVASSGFRPSLRTSRVLPWAPRKLIWRPKKILEQCPENFGQDSVPRLNGSADPAATGQRHIWGLSLSGKIHKYLVFRGRNANGLLALSPISSRMPPGCIPRVYGSGPLCCRLQVGLLLRPFLIILVSSLRRFYRVATLRFPRTCTVHKTPFRPVAVEESVTFKLSAECGASAAFAIFYSRCR